MPGFLLVNPRAGSEEPSAEELVEAAQERGTRSRLRAALRLVSRGGEVRLAIDGEPVAARIVVVGNNVYRLHPLEVGTRPHIDGGILHLGIARGLLPWSWEERRAER